MGIREEYYAKIESQLKEWNTKIEELKELAKGSKDEAREKIEKVIGSLMTKREAAQKKLQDLKKASDEAWVDIKVGVENAGNELKEAVEKAVSQFKQGDKK